MNKSQHVVAYVWNEALRQETVTETIDTVRTAERRATLVFDLLLTYLSDSDFVIPRQSP